MADSTPLALAGLDIHLFGLEHGAAAPVVFVTHGRGGAVESIFDQCAALAAAGLIAIGVEQRNHGRRAVDPEQNGAYGPTFPTTFYANMLGTAADISLLIDLLPARLGLAMTRVGVEGASMGGHVTLLAMARDPRITVGAALIGSGDFLCTQRGRAADHGVPAAELDTYLPPALTALAARADPIANAAAFADRPLLLANGDDDTLVPITGNARFYAACLPHYRHPERLRLSRYPGVGHAVPPAMWAEAQAWLARWL
ncbi:MAG TPA: prolyl oligopeptidase family serine peptidase [Armatimonadota bacterium]|nr:prolyl oligopeptidase family serine peptidase [Armatimonadota bacterium]